MKGLAWRKTQNGMETEKKGKLENGLPILVRNVTSRRQYSAISRQYNSNYWGGGGGIGFKTPLMKALSRLCFSPPALQLILNSWTPYSRAI